MKDSASFKFGQAKNQIKRKCHDWYRGLSLEKKKENFGAVENSICKYLEQGYSINLSKALTRDDLNIGFKLVDHIARSSMKVLCLQGELKQEKLSKQNKL